MAKITSNGPQPIKPVTTNASIITSTFSKRSAIDLLPAVNQTDTLVKFFNATIDHMFQPENVEFISGYIGSKPSYYDSSKDFYITEITKDRQIYQLPVTAISTDPTSAAVNNVMFYDDTLNQLALQGANIKNPSRLFESEYYSWLPPLNPDKFINFYEYYWLPDGPGVIQLISPTNLKADVIGKSEYTFTGTYYRLADDKTITGSLKLSSGMRIQVMNDSDPSYTDVILLVEEVGTSIKIEPDYLFPNPGWDIPRWDVRSWDGEDINNIPDYMTISRLSRSYNRWSVNNRWFHKDILLTSGINIFDKESNKASRPIIEFSADLHLHNFGTYGLPDVDLVDTTTNDIFEKVAGKSSHVLDGINLIDGMLILFTADTNSDVNNRVYEVTGIEKYGEITLNLVKRGQNLSGEPAYGDCTYSVYGTTNGKKSWWYNGTNWVAGQDRAKYTAPVFAGYDMYGNKLNDTSVYPGSDFAGTTIFTYAIDENASVDSELQIKAKRDQFGFYIFENTLVTKTYTYIENGIQTGINGYTWYSDGEIGNGWNKCRGASRQYIVNSFDISVPTSTFLIDQIPAADIVGFLPNLLVYLIQDGNSRLLIKNVDYTISNRLVTFTTPAIPVSRVEIYSWSANIPAVNNGYYQTPVNLIANPNNEQPSTLNFNQTIKHFSSLISNQSTEKSNGIGNTGWRDSGKILGLGTSILQHRSPLLKLMILNSNNINTGALGGNTLTDPSLAIQWAQKEYIKFYNRFIRTLFNLYDTRGYDKSTPLQQWIDTAISQLNLGKSKASAWAYSGYEQTEDFTSTKNPTFVPPTGAKLGIAPVFAPEVYLDNDYYPPKLILQTHDGARIVLEDLNGNTLGTIDNGVEKTNNPEILTDPVAAVWLQFELNLYDAIPTAYKDIDAVPAFDQRIYRPGKWRSIPGTENYTRNEYLDVLRPSFDKWIITSQVDYIANTTFQENNQFSFNYSTCVDRDGNSVPGYWRGIYNYFYDTDRPHTHPWEMLGFSQKPLWWNSEYGPAPYTRGNTQMWNDLSLGIIRQGERAGTYHEWARPGLLNSIPVDEQGQLLPPLLAGTVVSLPSFKDAQAEWSFGDGAPIEDVWLHGLDYSFTTALTSYLMKPARFIEQCWDPLRVKKVGSGDSQQYVYIDTNRRRSSSEFYVHRENPSSLNISLNVPNETTLSFFGSWGVQHWISEYLVSQNLSVTNNIGTIIRGLYSGLAHKFGGFVGTDNSLRVMVDSFGQLGYTSQLVPSENIQTYLYRSSSLGTYFYSGVIIVKQSNGWKVYGYDGINPNFTTIPSVINGPKSSKVIGNATVIDYKTGAGLATVPYGTIFDTLQDVYDFIISYGRWLESQGWVFENMNSDNNKVVNWRQSARDFVYWSQGKWTNGNFIAISPAAELVKFKKDFGTIQYVNGTVGGTYPVLDRAGQPIEVQNVEVLRQDGEMTISSMNDQSIFGLRLYLTTVEHIMLVSNVTQFNDLIYDPLYNVSQPRLKLYGYRTNLWNGRLDAPGYFLYQDPVTNQWKMLENFEKTSEDFRNLYNIDQPKNILQIDSKSGQLVENNSVNHAVTRYDLSNLAKHTMGYQKRDYLENLLLDETTQFEFYQGFIKQKGTRRSIDNMLRNSSILGIGETVNYYEEYAFRKARYGAVSLNTNIDFIIPQSEVVNNPQRIDVFSRYDSTQQRDGVIEIAARDPNIVVPPETYEGKLFPLRSSTNNALYYDLPTSGFVQLGEATYSVVDEAELYNLNLTLESSGKQLEVGDTVWQFTTSDNTWDIYKVVPPLSDVKGTAPLGVELNTDIIFNSNHGILEGDIVVITNFKNNVTLNSTFTVQSVTETTISIPISTFIEDINGEVKVLRSLKFYDKEDLLSYNMLSGWEQGDLTYCVHGEAEGQWTVYRFNINAWEIYRKAEHKVNNNLILSGKLYNKVTFSDIKNLEYFDPGKGAIPGVADKNITFKSVYDPAQYNSGDTSIYSLNPDEAWAEAHVGEVWWDLSTTRYVDYESGPLDYRAKNWGKLAPNTDIDMYEWVKSPLPPSEWTNYTSIGASLARLGIPYVPSGTVRNSESPVWTEKVEYDSNGNAKTWYFFWVGNSNLAPLGDRTLTTNEIRKIIKDPGENSIPWFAVIGERSLIVSNIDRYVVANNIVMQVVYSDKPNDANDYKEWTLIRKDDPKSYIDAEYWQKLRDSLTGFDALGNQVPDPLLNELQRYGTLVRPRQSWFKDRLEALKIWANNVNTQLSSAANPLVLDSSKSTWSLYFNQSEPIPSAYGNYEYKINDMSELSLIRKNAKNGERVLVLPTAINNNMWTIWQWDSVSNDFILARKQAYNVQNYWKYVDWYYTGYSSNTIPTYTVDTVVEKDSINISNNETIKVSDFGSQGWALFGVVNGETRIVGLQDGTIQILKTLWDTDLNLTGFDQVSLDTIPFDYNPVFEIGLIFDGVVNGIYGSTGKQELNQLFFTMINFVLNEHNYVDWVFKTSFIIINGSKEPLMTGELYKPNTVDILLDYINEAKPYSSKVREFVSGRTTSDSAAVQLTDFDKPIYEGRVLNELDTTDQNIMINSSTVSPWFNNYKSNSTLIRKLKTQLVFDRVSSMPEIATIINATSSGSTVTFTVKPANVANSFKVGEKISVSNVWNQGNTVVSFTSNEVVVSYAKGNVIVGSYSGDIGVGTGIGGAVFHQAFGAADRIMRDYIPSTYMPPAFSPDLISGTDYKGIIYSGGNLNMDPGWGMAAWGFAAGWDADDAAFEDFIDIILEGGAAPVYDQFYGDGVRTLYRLNKIPQDLYGSKVWKDKVLAVYGVDYYIPNWATDLVVSKSGSGYKVGEKLKLLEDDPREDTVPTEFTVTSVSSSGAIRSVTIDNPGFFNVVQYESYKIEYTDTYYIGTGKNARIQPTWGGSTLKFLAAPMTSSIPNIWVLYAGTTFDPAPAGEYDMLTDGNEFNQPTVEADHAEERYNTRLRDAIRIDTYSNYVGGMPEVWQKSYITSGIIDRYDIGVRPQTESAVEVFLDGILLKYGPSEDYVINFETGDLIFVRPPAENKRLTIIAIGEGGTGNTISAAYPVNRGTNYRPSDEITFSGGVPAKLGNGSSDRAVVRVDSVTAVNLTISNGGTGFKTGEILQLNYDGSSPSEVQSKLLVKVERVSITGQILEASIYNAGSYTTLPVTYSWESSNLDGKNLNMAPVWGVNAVTVQTPGLYNSKPTVPYTQLSTTSENGLGATFQVYYTSIINKETFVADGETGIYTLRRSSENIQDFMITVNGTVVQPLASTITSVTIAAPVYGSFVVVTLFNTTQYSRIISDEFVINGDPSYELSRSSANTVPEYSTVQVFANGAIVPPPLMISYIGDGYTHEFTIRDVPTNLNYLEVYLDSILQPAFVYSTYPDKIIFATAPAEGAEIVFLNKDPANGVFYSLNGYLISFFGISNGTVVNVITYTQDLSYKAMVEEFEGNSAGEYQLEGKPSSYHTITVTVNGKLQRMLWDYNIVMRTAEGYDIFGYDVYPYDLGPVRYFIVFGSMVNHTAADNVVVRYMQGLPERPGIAFRQFIDSSMFRQTTAIDFNARTILLTNVEVNSSSIMVEDYTVLTQPTLSVPGSVWINNEKIDFFEVKRVATTAYPNRAFLTNLVRGSGGTCSSPEIVYNTTLFDGDGSTVYYPTGSGIPVNGITVLVNNKVRVGGNVAWYELNGTTNTVEAPAEVLSISCVRLYLGADQSTPLVPNSDYYIMANNMIGLKLTYPASTIIRIEVDNALGVRSHYYLGTINGPESAIIGKTVGVYVVFDKNKVPPVGFNNIKFIERVTTSLTLCHLAGAIVQDAGTNVIIPGGYTWEPSPNGLQYNSSPMAKFLLEHPGTPG